MTRRQLGLESLDSRRLLAVSSFSSQELVVTERETSHFVAVADIDADGDSDVVAILAFAEFSDNRVSWFENLDGRGAFGPERLISESFIPLREVVVVDIDGDGDLDVASTASYGGDYPRGELVWYANDGSGSFAEGQRSMGGEISVTFQIQ